MGRKARIPVYWGASTNSTTLMKVKNLRMPHLKVNPICLSNTKVFHLF